ncbi:MAG: response regulator [Candidatus Niyogibacteria bacterium]|nr:response regulator [Candidatus Niyogibacteria bacterium]
MAKKILLVDDDTTFLAVLGDWFTGKGFEVHKEQNGPSALEYLKKGKIDVIILDFVMQPMNGIEVLEKIKGNTSTKHIPVFLLSQLGEGEHIAKARELGAEDYLVKSNFNLESLTARINAIIENKS